MRNSASDTSLTATDLANSVLGLFFFFYQYLCLYMLCDILAVTAVLIRILEIRYCMVNLVIMYE